MSNKESRKDKYNSGVGDVNGYRDAHRFALFLFLVSLDRVRDGTRRGPSTTKNPDRPSRVHPETEEGNATTRAELINNRTGNFLGFQLHGLQNTGQTRGTAFTVFR